MNQFTKKPVTINAIQLDATIENANKVLVWLGEHNISAHRVNVTDVTKGITLQTVNGYVTALPGDWIIKQNDLDFYPCSDEVFQKNYAPMQQTTWLERVKQEKANMQSMLDALEMTLRTESKPDVIAQDQWDLMHRQQFHMRQYVQILEERINKAEV